MSVEKFKAGYDLLDKKWAHPEIEDAWTGIEETESGNFDAILKNPDLTNEEKQAQLDAVFAQYLSPGNPENCTIEKYQIPGCPEEPDTPAEVWVYTPNKVKKKMPALFYCMGGGMQVCLPQMCPLEDYCDIYNCVLVLPVYRTTLRGKYPAAINDCHAAYQWMIQHAEKLHINLDKIVILGASTGGHLATAVPFRLKRYDWCSGPMPRGVVAMNPITDDRSLFASGKFRNITWSGKSLREMTQSWLGENYCSPMLPPEAFANRATVEDCIGLPPYFIHAGEFDPDRDNSRHFIGKVQEAGVMGEYHIWGGIDHGVSEDPSRMTEPVRERIYSIIKGNIEDCFKYDMRRAFLNKTP